MALPTKNNVLTLDYAYLGAPFADVSAGATGGTTLDVAYLGAPFAGIVETSMTIDSNLTMPAITGSGITFEPNHSSQTMPLITAGGTGTVGAVGNSRDGVLDPQFLPAFTGSGSTLAPNMPAIQASSTGFSGVVARSTLDLPDLVAVSSGNPGFTGSSSATLAAFTGSGGTPPVSMESLPALSGSASAFSGALARSTATLGALDGTATASVPLIGTSALSLPLPLASGTASTGNVGSSSATLAAFVLAGEGFSGALGTSTLTLPILTGEGTGYVEVVGTSTLTLPAIVASGQAGTIVGTTYSAYALNSETRALTTYSNLPIKGLAKFNGVYLAAGPGGLFVLGGDTDAGALIDASVRLAATDFGDPAIKRVEAMYVHYRTTGDLALNVIINEHEQYEYTLPAVGHTTLSPQRVKIGKGAKGTYWQFDITNRDGADFEFDRIAVEPLATSRRVG